MVSSLAYRCSVDSAVYALHYMHFIHLLANLTIRGIVHKSSEKSDDHEQKRDMMSTK